MAFLLVFLYSLSFSFLGFSSFLIVEGFTEQFEFFTFSGLLYVSLQDTWQTLGSIFLLLLAQTLLLTTCRGQYGCSLIVSMSCAQLVLLCCYVDSFNFLLLTTQLPEYLPKLGEFSFEYVLLQAIIFILVLLGRYGLGTLRSRRQLLFLALCIIAVGYPVQGLYLSLIFLTFLFSEFYYYLNGFLNLVCHGKT